jgi:acetyl-CoA carboxylase biotin carboxyl carrier protein
MKESEGQDPAGRKQRNAPVEKKGSAKPEPSVNMEELRELIALLRENDLAEFEVEREGFRVRLRRGVDYDRTEAPSALVPQPAPPAAVKEPKTAAGATPSHPGAMAETAASEDQDLHMITSPIVGTFYRSRSPNAAPFVKTGSEVEPATIVCIIEAMKLMNEIQAESSGEVVKIYVENGQPVEYGQPLFGIKR